MSVLIIEGVSPQLDGEYDLQIDSFTNRELHLIKQETGVRAGELADSFAAGDNDLVVVMALIMLQRAGKGTAAQLRDAIWDAEAGTITFDLSDVEKAEEDARPPESEHGSSGNEAVPTVSSGLSSDDGSGSPLNGRSRTGSPLSGTGVTSDPQTLVT